MLGGRRSALPRLVARRHARYAVVACVALAVSDCSHDRSASPAVAESVALTATATSLAIGQSVTLYVHASDANGTRIPAFSAVTWSSSNPTVASVTKSDTSAVVTGLAVGETVVSATIRSGLVAQMSLRVGSVPVILATPSAAVFTGYRGGAVTPQSIAITNAGAGALSALSATTSSPWLLASFVGGVDRLPILPRCSSYSQPSERSRTARTTVP